MKEVYLGKDKLTQKGSYSTLDKGHNTMVINAMPEPPRELTLDRPRKSNTSKDVFNKPQRLAVEDVAFFKKPQADREVARAIIQTALDEGRSLTEEEAKFVRSSELVPRISGGADVPENENEDEEAKRRRGKFDSVREININSNGISHPRLVRMLERIDELNDVQFTSPAQLFRALTETYYVIEDLPDDLNNPAFNEQKRLLLNRTEAEIEKMKARNERIGFYLQDNDREELLVDPIGWLDRKFDHIYQIALSGQELDSPTLRNMETLVGDASQFLERRFEEAFKQGKIESKEKYKKFIDIFNKIHSNRINLFVTKTTIENGTMENVAGAFGKLRVEGLLGSLSFDDSKTGAMFNRVNDYVEMVRQTDGGAEKHLTPAMMSRVQPQIEEEQFLFAKQGIGIFAEDYIKAKEKAEAAFSAQGEDVNYKKEKFAEDLLRAEIKRAVRTGYDVAIASQQIAIRSARGKEFKNALDAFSSDFIGAFSFMNTEAYLINKYGILNHEQEQFFKFIKIFLAEQLDKPKDFNEMTFEQKLELGRRRFRDLDAAPDFFSSGWRIKKMLEQIERITKYKIQNQEIEKIFAHDLSESKKTQNSRNMKLDSRVFERFKLYLELRKKSSKWEYVKNEQGENAANLQVITDFVRGAFFTDTEDLSFPSGLSLEERNNLIITNNLDNEIITNKAKEASKDLGLFLRLKSTDASYEVLGEGVFGDKKEYDKNARKDLWKKIQKYRPEEMIRIMVDRLDPNNEKDKFMLRKIANVFSEVGGFNSFKAKYGGVLHAIREDLLLNGVGRQIDIRELNNKEFSKQLKQVDAVGNSNELINIFKKMDNFFDSNGIIKQFLESWQYEDIYKRTLLVDDAILSHLEYIPENSGLLRLSQTISTEPSKDGLKRNANDFLANEKATSIKVGLLSKEGFENFTKDAESFHSTLASYNGVDEAVKGFFGLEGAFMLFSLQDYWADVLQIGKFPFRVPTSDIERVFGYGQKPITAEDARSKLDHISMYLGGRDNPHKYYHRLEKLLRADRYSMLRDKSFSILLYLLAIVGLVPLAASTKAVAEASR